MKRSVRIVAFVSVFGAAVLSGCSRLVDEDQSDCGGAVRIDYRLRLVTNVRTELETVLSEEKDIPVRNALQPYLEGIFTDVAHDADLSFYEETGVRLEHLEPVPERERFDCSLYLPAGTILHACTANVADNGPVTLEGGDTGPSGHLVQHAAEDVADPHRTALFAGRKTLSVRADADQQYEVDLTVVNAATALVLETEGAEGISGIQAYVAGFADGFHVADSTWIFTETSVVRTDDLPVEAGTQRCFASVHFPSRDYRPETRTITETADPFRSEPSPEPLWRWRVYVRIADGSVTESILEVMTPLRAGQLKVLKAKVFDTGIVSVTDPTVGVSVTLDWNEGGSHIIDF